MKIPFDIKYRPQIESGKYKVETEDGIPARIICWDSPIDKERPIIAIVFDNQIEQYKADGRYDDDFGPSNYDLFIVMPEEELTEFEKALADIIGYAISQSVVEPNYEIYKFVKDWSERLLDATKKELCKGCAANLEGYIKGRQDALKEREENRVYIYPTPHTLFPSCYHGGPCTNPMHDCINCPRQSTMGINTTTGTSAAKVDSHE